MKRGLFALLAAVLLVIGPVAFAASVEEFITAIPQGNPTTDSTFAQAASSAADWIDLAKTVHKFDRLEVAVYWAKTSDIDTLEMIFRVAFDPTVPIPVDSSTLTASGVYQKVYTLDSLDFAAMQYWQVVARLAAIDNTNALRTQNIRVYYRWWRPDETVADWRAWTIPMVVTE